MRIATWNVNSIRQRLTHVQDWLQQQRIDILLLQETKCVDEQFPAEALEDLGYNLVVHGQKTFNGVAILSKFPIEDVQRGLPDFEDAQARYIEAFTGGVRVASVYVPNGQEVGCDKYDYKLNFLSFLHKNLQQLQQNEEIIVVGGDFNIAPTDIDVYDPDVWKDQILCSPKEREAFESLKNLGYTDLLRLHHVDAQFTWWDYRMMSFRRNLGLRIDHLLCNTPERCSQAEVDKTPRGLEKPSDHAPVWCEINTAS